MEQKWLYILHFHDALSHAKHYVGVTTDPITRAIAHARGKGARITQVLRERGITWSIGTLAQIAESESMFAVETRIKARKDTSRYCRICHPRDAYPIPGATALDPELFTLVEEVVRDEHV